MLRALGLGGKWGKIEPKAVAPLMREKDRPLLYYRFPESLRTSVRTTNPIERFKAELEKKFARVGFFPTLGSWERLTYTLHRDLEAQRYPAIGNKLIFPQNTRQHPAGGMVDSRRVVLICWGLKHLEWF
mgnify:FL=1